MFTVREVDRRFDIAVRKGASRSVYWKITDLETGLPKNLTGWHAHCQVRVEPDESATLLYEWVPSPALAQGQISVDNSRVTLILDPLKTALWEWNEGYYDCELVSPDGLQIEEVGWGRFHARNEITS